MLDVRESVKTLMKVNESLLRLMCRRRVYITHMSWLKFFRFPYLLKSIK